MMKWPGLFLEVIFTCACQSYAGTKSVKSGTSFSRRTLEGRLISGFEW